MNVDALDTMWIWSARNTSTPQSPIAAPAPSARPQPSPAPSPSARPQPKPQPQPQLGAFARHCNGPRRLRA